MLLSDRDILAAILAGQLTIDPFDPRAVQPASVDIRLGQFLRVFNHPTCTHINPAMLQGDLTSLVTVPPGGRFVLHPHEFALATTVETVTLGAELAARIEGKSSLGRLGLLTHATAGFVDPGFTGQLTLELSNAAPLPIVVWPGMKIGQLCFFRLTSPAKHPYGSGVLGSRYQGQVGPTASRSHLNFTAGPTRNECT